LADTDIAYLEALHRGRGRAEKRICDQKKRPLGYRLETTQPSIDGKPGVRLVLAPVRWTGWDNLPTVHVVKTPP
ncbi:MAG TPA: hypothetical protein VLA89_04620, partial [Gemmatimonadales bacterium]|nr:hypothetical protein [Gemmatimonadales bacterium]